MLRHLQLKNHNGNDDGKHAIAKSLKPACFHGEA
jgi:hypothetical protein